MARVALPSVMAGNERCTSLAHEQMAQKAAAYTTALASRLNGSPADTLRAPPRTSDLVDLSWIAHDSATHVMLQWQQWSTLAMGISPLRLTEHAIPQTQRGGVPQVQRRTHAVGGHFELYHIAVAPKSGESRPNKEDLFCVWLAQTSIGLTGASPAFGATTI